MSDLGNDPTQVNVPVAGGPPPPAGPRGPQANDPYGSGGPDDPEGPQNRWPYLVIVALLVVIIIGFGYFLLKDGNNDDSASPGVTATTVADDSTTTIATIAPTTPTSLPPEPTAPTVPEPSVTTVPSPSVTTDPAQCRESGSAPDDPELPAQVVFVAWTHTDVLCAQELMTSGAFDILFGRDGTDAQDQFQGCNEVDDGDPYIDCAFTYEGGATHYLMNFSATDGWQVFDVTQMAD